MISRNSDLASVPYRPGVADRVPKHDAAVLEVVEMTIDAGTQMKSGHTHDQSEVFYVAEGRLRVKVGDEEATIDKGSYFFISAGTPHEFMEIIEKTVLVNVRTPVASQPHAHDHPHDHTHDQGHAHDHPHDHGHSST